jgi:hypothetical protein
MVLKTASEFTCHPSSCHFGSLKMACKGMRSGRGRRMKGTASTRQWEMVVMKRIVVCRKMWQKIVFDVWINKTK